MDPRPWRRFKRNRGALAGAVLIAIVAAAAALAPILAPFDPKYMDFDRGFTRAGGPVAPTATHPLGTDLLGRDEMSRILHGASVSLQVGVAASVIALLIGLVVGLCAGYFGGVADRALMGLVDMLLAFPFLLLVMFIAAVVHRAGLATIFILLGLTGWTTVARVIRGKVLETRELDFVTGARALGAGHLRILARHILPNVAGPAVVLATMGVAHMVLAEAVLSYLNLGVPPPTPSWGSMLSEGQPYYRLAPWLVAAPGLAILLTVLGFNLVGEGLRDALDPKE